MDLERTGERTGTDPELLALVERWLHEPNEVFRGLKPIELIERGEMKPLWWMIYDLESGNPT